MRGIIIIRLSYVLHILLAVLIYLPVSARMLNVGDKPVDIVFSDLFVFSLSGLYIFKAASTKVTVLERELLYIIALASFFFLMIALVESVNTGGLLPIFSAIKYVKIFVALLAGMYFSHCCKIEKFWRLSAAASFLIIVSLCISQFILLGQYSPRWGGFIILNPVYGYPNSSAQYYVLLLMFLIVSVSRGYKKLPYCIAIAFTALFMIFSLSRSSVVILLIFLLLSVLFATSLKSKLTRLFPLIGISVLLFAIVLNNNVFDDVQGMDEIVNPIGRRLKRTFSSNDPFSGRIDIAKEAFELINAKPLLGYKFESFSNYHDGHSTPHNQYIEAFYKTGAIGAIIYFGVMFIFVWVVSKNVGRPTTSRLDQKGVIMFFCALASLMVGNLTQPNFTYSQTGNVVFFILGYFSLVRFTPLRATINRNRCQ